MVRDEQMEKAEHSPGDSGEKLVLLVTALMVMLDQGEIMFQAFCSDSQMRRLHDDLFDCNRLKRGKLLSHSVLQTVNQNSHQVGCNFQVGFSFNTGIFTVIKGLKCSLEAEHHQQKRPGDGCRNEVGLRQHRGLMFSPAFQRGELFRCNMNYVAYLCCICSLRIHIHSHTFLFRSGLPIHNEIPIISKPRPVFIFDLLHHIPVKQSCIKP